MVLEMEMGTEMKMEWERNWNGDWEGEKDRNWGQGPEWGQEREQPP